MKKLKTQHIHPSWQPCFSKAFATLPQSYIQELEQTPSWYPGPDRIFNAFTLPLTQVNHILFGESPYPRQASANGYAFWDQAVDGLWSTKGLATAVNRATSLRNFLKMLLLARGDLQATNLSQEAIAKIDKTPLIQHIDELFKHLMDQGVMLLNASLVLHPHEKQRLHQDAKIWHRFIAVLLQELFPLRPHIQLILFGNVAKRIDAIPVAKQFKGFHAEHPYNISFITNPNVLALFKPFDLLSHRGSNAHHESSRKPRSERA